MFDEYYVNEPICLVALTSFVPSFTFALSIFLTVIQVNVQFTFSVFYIFVFFDLFLSLSPSRFVAVCLLFSMYTIFLERDVNKHRTVERSKCSNVLFLWYTSQSFFLSRTHTNKHIHLLKCFMPYLNYPYGPSVSRVSK